MRIIPILLFLVSFSIATAAAVEPRQNVEGFDQVTFHYSNLYIGVNTRDFRGPSKGYMTAAWWAPGQMKDNRVAWKTAVVPARQTTTFWFIASSSVVPSEFSRGPQAKLTVNGRDAVTFTLGMNRDYVWNEGDCELKYVSKRVDYPYAGWERQRETHGNSGIYQLTVPANFVEAGQGAVLEVKILPFERWNNGWFMIKERRDVLHPPADAAEGELETVRRDIGRLNEQMQILATKLYPELNPRQFTHHVVYNNGYRHIHPADLIQLRNGELLIMAREATEHFARDGDVIMLRSKDGGLTWGERQVIGGLKDLDEREGCGLQLRDGTIVVAIFYNGNYASDGSYGQMKDREPGKRHLGTYLIRSTDNGRTWSEPSYLETTGMPFQDTEGPTDAPIEMPDGSVLMAVIGYKLNGDPKNNGSVMLRSTDKGVTWKYLSTIASDDGGKLGGLVEPGIVLTKSVRIVAGLRTPGNDGVIHVTYSDDQGKTWVPYKKTAMIGHPADLIQLADGRIMMSYGVRPRLHQDPGGIRVCFSSDNGETWDISTEIQLRSDFLNFDVGYPESLQFPDGHILTVYYYNLFGKYYLGSTMWQP